MKVFRNWQLEGFAVSSFDYEPRGVAGTAGILNDTVKVRAAGQSGQLELTHWQAGPGSAGGPGRSAAAGGAANRQLHCTSMPS